LNQEEEEKEGRKKKKSKKSKSQPMKNNLEKSQPIRSRCQPILVFQKTVFLFDFALSLHLKQQYKSRLDFN